MSTGRALYSTANGRALYSATSGRVLYSDWEYVSPTEMQHYYGVGGVNAWDSTAFAQANTDAAAALDADTSLSADSYPYEPGCWLTTNVSYNDYSIRSRAFYQLNRVKYTIPSGKRGSITKVALRTSGGGAKGWNGSRDGIYKNLDWVDLDASVHLFFSESSSEYASGAAQLTGTPDVTITVADINAAHIALENVITSSGGHNMAPDIYFDYLTLDISGVADKLNGFSGDTVYMWIAITIPTFAYLYNHAVWYDDWGYWLKFGGSDITIRV